MSRPAKKAAAAPASTAEHNGSNGREPDSAHGFPASPKRLRWWDYFAACGLALGLFVWLFHPDMLELLRSWQREADYSHGFLVVPAALLFLWVRRDTCPGPAGTVAWGGLLVIGAALAVRAAGHRLFLSPLMGWSMILWVAGVCWLLGGRRLLAWALPSILFLLFMVPLPYRSEQWLAQPLQKLAARLSTAALQVLGQPAIAQGNTILLGDAQLEVEQACAGLRMLVGVAALAVGFGILTRRSRSEMLLLILSVAPVALLANCVRITATAIAYQCVADEAARHFWHDAAGWIVIPLAAVMMWLMLAYWNRVFELSETTSVQELVGAVPRSRRAGAKADQALKEATHV